MKPTELRALIEARVKAGIKRPLHVESSPGVGKTQIAGQAAKDLGIGFKVIHAPTMQPEDYGFPSVSADKTDVKFIVSKDKFPIKGSDCPEQGILLIDELPQADTSAQKVLANLLQEREIHGQHLKPGWFIVSTGNRAIDRAGANRLLSHLKNRITTVSLDANLDDWVEWALANNSVKTEVISFLRFRPALLNNFDPQQEINPTPRSWAEGVSAALGVVAPEVEFAVITGDVGEGAAAEFSAFLKVCRKLPSVESILNSPDSTEVPTDPATLYAVIGSLTDQVKVANFGAMTRYVKRMPPEFLVLFVNDAQKREVNIVKTKEFRDLAVNELAKILI